MCRPELSVEVETFCGQIGRHHKESGALIGLCAGGHGVSRVHRVGDVQLRAAALDEPRGMAYSEFCIELGWVLDGVLAIFFSFLAPVTCFLKWFLRALAESKGVQQVLGQTAN